MLSTRPIDRVLASDNALAALFGFHPIVSATRNTFSRVSLETPGLSFSAYETALLETPAARATSEMVTLALPILPPTT